MSSCQIQYSRRGQNQAGFSCPIFFVRGSVGIIIAVILASAANGQDFNRDIRPILSDRCFKCHGPDSAANDSGLRLDIESEAHDSEAFVPGDIEASSSIQRILSDDEDMKMPPPESHLTISDRELELLKKWVKAGAKYDQHWAFKPLPKDVIVPHYSMDRPWIKHSIDVFVMRSLEARNLKPTEEAERWRWLRRVTYDLTGLPPTAEEIEAFEADDSFDAYEKVVDRLLASRRFGEHMAVSWLDAARYADSYGYQSDNLSPTWPYRDWVIRAINDNLPYDEFLKWQLAGDLMPTGDRTKDRDRTLATAFNRLHRQTNEGGSVELEWRTEYVADRVNTFGTAMLGMTLECARCHDHKFDPVSHRDYYNTFAFFNNIDEWGMYHDSSRVPTPSLLLPNEQQEKQLDELALLPVLRARRQLRDKVKNEMDEWKQANKKINVERPQPVAHWTLDAIAEKNQLANEIEGGKPGRTSPNNQLVEGVKGQALKMTGDDAAEFPVDGNWLEPWQPYSISFWLNVPEGLNKAVILHRQGGTDVGNFGTKVSIENGRLRFAMVRFWPGNAIAVETRKPIGFDRWLYVTVTNDGSCRSSGMSIYIDGRRASKKLRDNLQKDPQFRPGNHPGFVVGEQFRRIGLKKGKIDEISVFDFALTPIEVRCLKEAETEFSVNDFSEGELVEHIFSTRLTAEQRREIQEDCKTFLQTRVRVAETMVMKEREGDPNRAYVLNRGEYDAPRTDENLAERKTLAALPPMPDDYPQNRLGLAKWLTSDQHPLTARVAVNRFWQGFFGKGLASTPNDFGYQSSLPEHPEMLDWLARDFVDSGWNVKQLCKSIVLSSTYRQSSRSSQELRERDPENRWLGRGPSNRLTAEMIRDTALFASGLLNEQMHGPPVSPYQPVNIWRENNTMTPAYRQSVGKALYRRSLYTVWKRTTPMPNMMTFDATSREVCTVERSRTNTPQQAMVLLNDVQFVEAARVFAERVMKAEVEIEARIQRVFMALTARKADTRELGILKALYDEQLARFKVDMENAKKLVAVGDAKTNEDSDPIELAATTVLVQAVFSSDATIWRR